MSQEQEESNFTRYAAPITVRRDDLAGTGTLERVTRLLAGIEGGAEKALEGAMARAGSHLRTNSGRAIRERYDISQAAIRDEQTIKTRYSYQNGVSLVVTFSGHKIPLHRFGGAAPAQPTEDTGRWVNAKIQGTWRKVHPALTARGHQLRSTSPEQFQNAFVARMASGHVGIFERTGGVSGNGSDEIREVMGSSVAQMVGSQEVADKLVDEAMDKFDERLEHEITALLNGWR